MRRLRALAPLLMGALLLPLLAGCAEEKKTSKQVYEETQRALIEADSGDVVEIPAGTWSFQSTLSLAGVEDVTLRGEGRDETIINFAEQTGGAEGIKVQDAPGVTLEAFTVQDMGGDGVKLMNSDDATLRNLRVEWTAGSAPSNGGYGLYPVSLSDITIANNEVTGASDAGIYLGQARGGVIKNNTVTGNVQGIAIENCIGVKAHGNTATGNTAGIAIYNLPDLPLARGHDIEVFDNTIRGNNHPNFGAEGAIVHTVPAGTGLFVLAGIDVNIHDNEIAGHRTTGTGVISYEMTGRPAGDEDYYPYSRGVKIHDNTYKGNAQAPPDTTRRIGKLVARLFGGDPPEILYDGIADPDLMAASTGSPAPESSLCVADNENAQFANINAPSGFQNVISDAGPYACAKVSSSDSQRPATASISGSGGRSSSP